MKLEKRRIETIRPYERNPRVIPERAIKAVAKSIEEFGWQQPIVVDADGVIIAGHTRYLAAKHLRHEEVPVAVATELTPDQVNAYRIADNKTGEVTQWNLDLLPDEIAGLEDIFDFTKLGFDRDELDTLMGRRVSSGGDPDKLPLDVPPKPITKPGDVVTLGDHRLICGDCTNPETVAKLMQGETADIVITDPPYGVSYKGSPAHKRKKIENDNFVGDELRKFLAAAFIAAKQYCRPGAAFYVWYASISVGPFINAVGDSGLEYRQGLVWVKSWNTLCHSDYHYQHELCLYCKVPGAPIFWNGFRTQKTVLEDEKTDLKKLTDKQVRQELKRLIAAIQTDVIREKKPTKSPLHPTTKPVRLYTRLIHNSSKRGDILLDVFGGSGTAVIAAEMTGRRARVIEIDPWYCDTIVQRFEDFTGQEVTRATGPP